jgi:hypothetical protein
VIGRFREELKKEAMLEYQKMLEVEARVHQLQQLVRLREASELEAAEFPIIQLPAAQEPVAAPLVQLIPPNPPVVDEPDGRAEGVPPPRVVRLLNLTVDRVRQLMSEQACDICGNGGEIAVTFTLPCCGAGQTHMCVVCIRACLTRADSCPYCKTVGVLQSVSNAADGLEYPVGIRQVARELWHAARRNGVRLLASVGGMFMPPVQAVVVVPPIVGNIVQQRDQPGDRNLFGVPGRVLEPALVEESVCVLRDETVWDIISGGVPNFINKDVPWPQCHQYVVQTNERVIMPEGFVDTVALSWAARQGIGDDDRMQMSAICERAKNLCLPLNLLPSHANNAVRYGPVTAYHRWHRQELLTNSHSRSMWFQRWWIVNTQRMVLLSRCVGVAAKAATIAFVLYKIARGLHIATGLRKLIWWYVSFPATQVLTVHDLPVSSVGSLSVVGELMRRVCNVIDPGYMWKPLLWKLCVLGDLSKELRGTVVSQMLQAVGGRDYYAMFGAPVLEEALFKRSPVIQNGKIVYKVDYRRLALFLAVECLEHTTIGRPDVKPFDIFRRYLGNQLPMHVVFAHLPLQLAIVLHSSWNMAATLSDHLHRNQILSQQEKTRHVLWQSFHGVSVLAALWLAWTAWRSRNMTTYCLENSKAVATGQKPDARVEYPEVPVGNDKVRAVQYAMGFENDKYRPVAFAPNYDNEVVSVNCRLLALTPVPVPAVIQQYVRWTHVNLRQLLPRSIRKNIKPLNFTEYLRMSNASPGVKRQLLRVRQELQRDGIDEYSELTATQVDLWTRRKAFVKVENNNYRSPLGVKEKSPRMIQGATPEFICLVGPWIASLQKRVKRDLGVNNFACFSAGISASKLATKLATAVGEIGENDVTSWDVSNTEPLAQAEVDWARRMGCPRATYQLMQANIIKRGRTSKGIKYRVAGIRASGDPYTSLFNTMHNLFMHIYLFCTHNNLSVGQASELLVMVANGDDNAMVIKTGVGVVMPDFVAGFRTLGFESKFILRSTILELEYCSNRVYPVESGYVFGPMPGKVLCKFGYVIDPPQHVPREQMMRGIALGLKAAVSHIPPLNCVVDHVIKLTEGHQAYYTRHEEWKMLYAEQRTCPATMDALGAIYGWSYTLQREFEAEVSKLRLGDSSDHVLWNFLCGRDAGHPSL